MAELIEFNTERLRLRQWRASDRKVFAELNADARVMAYFPAPLTRSESDVMADRCEALIEKRGWGFWAVEEIGRSDFIGFVGLHIPVDELPCSPCVEVGWRLAYDYWGKGYATEAAIGALSIGFDRLELDEVVAFTAVQNRRSRSVMERLGMQEDSDTFEHPQVPAGHTLREHCLYRMTAGQWLSGIR